MNIFATCTNIAMRHYFTLWQNHAAKKQSHAGSTTGQTHMHPQSPYGLSLWPSVHLLVLWKGEWRSSRPQLWPNANRLCSRGGKIEDRGLPLDSAISIQSTNRYTEIAIIASGIKLAVQNGCNERLEDVLHIWILRRPRRIRPPESVYSSGETRSLCYLSRTGKNVKSSHNDDR